MSGEIPRRRSRKPKGRASPRVRARLVPEGAEEGGARVVEAWVEEEARLADLVEVRVEVRAGVKAEARARARVEARARARVEARARARVEARAGARVEARALDREATYL